MNRLSFLALIAVACTVHQASALDLSVEQCVEFALHNNSGLKAFEMDVIASGEQINSAQKSFLPTLKLTGNYLLLDKSPRLIIDRNSLGNNTPPDTVEIPTQDTSWYFLNLSLEQPLFTGGKLTHSYLKSKAVNEETLHRVAHQKRRLTLEVKSSYFAALNADLYAKSTATALKAKQERLRVLRELIAEGYAGQEDILQQETDIQFTELELNRANNRKTLELSRLRNLINHSGDDELQLTGKPGYRTLTASLAQVKDAALASREDLKAAYIRTRIAEEDIAIEKSAYFPRASLTANFIQQKETNITRSQQWMLGAQLEWHLFEWGKTVSEVSRKSAQMQKVKYESEELKKDALLKVEDTWRSIRDQEKAVQAHGKKVQTSSYRLRVETERYAEGRARLAEIVDREAEFIKDYSEYLTAVNNLNSSFAGLEEATCSDIGQWTRQEELMKPDLESHARRLQNILEKKRPTRAAKSSVEPEAVALKNLIRELTEGYQE